jgi:hypothetical protein
MAANHRDYVPFEITMTGGAKPAGLPSCCGSPDGAFPMVARAGHNGAGTGPSVIECQSIAPDACP